jgi:hypothetical protein
MAAKGKTGGRMKKIFILLTVLACLSSAAVCDARTAQTRLFCWSLRFGGASATDGIGFGWDLYFSRFPSSVNGELVPTSSGGYTHSTLTSLYSEYYDLWFYGTLKLNVPDGGDANGNGFPDFFESSQEVTGISSSGLFNSGPFFANLPVTVTWSRSAGSTFGTCILSLPDPWFPGDYMYFYFSFSLIEYTGSLVYTPGAGAVSGTLNLAQTEQPGNTLTGPVQFAKLSANQLTFQTAFLTNESAQTLSLYTTASVYRDTVLGTNYYGSFEFLDGDPNTVLDDYYSWELSIDDPNDLDGDGIPDFSDDLSSPPRRPLLTLTYGTTNLLLTISGDVGHTNQIQEASVLSQAIWSTLFSFKQTNDPQTVSLPLPATSPRFWRVIAQ